ncbi:hypothetical protein Hanom_Chr02g00104931 [Helianthus anomalus]
MYVCIGICERREEKEARRDRLVGAEKDGTGRGGRCGGPAPDLAGPKPTPIPLSLRLVSMGRLIPMRMGRHVGATSPSYRGWASSQFEGVG